MIVVYLAGKLRGNWFQKWMNIRRMKRIATYLWKKGIAVYSPHLNSGHVDSKETDKFVLPANIEMLKRCDAIYVTKKWENSQGTKDEIEVAMADRIPIFYNSKTLILNYGANNIKRRCNCGRI